MSAPADAWKDIPEGCPVCGRDACEDDSHVPPHDHPSPETNSEPKPSFVGDFISAATVAEESAPDCVIEDLLYRGGITVLAGESGSGKSFVILDAGTAVSEGRTWHDRNVTHGSVAYVAFEADALARRLQALRRQGRGLEDLYILRASDPLSPIVQRDGTELPSIGEQILLDRLSRLQLNLAERGRLPIGVLAIDTVRASLTGSEDSSEHVSAYLRSVRRVLRTLPDAGALLVHHAGWQDGENKRKRERGSSAFRGNVEVTTYLEVTDDTDITEVRLELKTLKARDSERRVPLRLIRRRIDLPEYDKFKQPLSSCIIERDARTYEEVEAERKAEQEQEFKAEQDELVKKVITVIRDNQITSQDTLRAYVGCARPKLQMAIARALSEGLATKATQRDSFMLTAAGREYLS